MSILNVQAFYIRLENDLTFRSQIEQVKSKDECRKITKAAGYDFTPQEFEEYTAQLLEDHHNNQELQDVSALELEAVVGGISAYLSDPSDPNDPFNPARYQCYGVTMPHILP
jgi:predicted ribosomally synthesized peptide with nif11-like leader